MSRGLHSNQQIPQGYSSLTKGILHAAMIEPKVFDARNRKVLLELLSFGTDKMEGSADSAESPCSCRPPSFGSSLASERHICKGLP